MTNRRRVLNTTSLFWVALLSAVSVSPVYAVANGTVVMAKGIVTATAVDQTDRILGKGAEVREGDTINTANKSFAVIRMVDKTKFTLKPNTTMIVGEFNSTPGKEIACANLVKGGLRTVTGLIGQRRPDAVQLDTPIASIGIRGTDFIALICQEGGSCSEDEQGDSDAATASNNDEEREEVIESIPQGLYSSCETGTVVLSKCAGQAANYQPGKCRINQQQDCIDVVLNAGQSAYVSYGKIELEEESDESAGKKSGQGSGSDSDSESDSGSESGQKSGSDSGRDSSSGSGSDSGSDSGQESGAAADSVADAESAAESGSESLSGQDASIDSGTVAGSEAGAGGGLVQDSATGSATSSGQQVQRLESKPGFISNDPYFKLSDMSDEELETMNLLMEEASGGIDGGFIPGTGSCEISG